MDALEHVLRRLPLAFEPLIQNVLERFEKGGAINTLGGGDEAAADKGIDLFRQEFELDNRNAGPLALP